MDVGARGEGRSRLRPAHHVRKLLFDSFRIVSDGHETSSPRVGRRADHGTERTGPRGFSRTGPAALFAPP